MCKHPGAISAKHLTPTTGGPACACLSVRFEPVTHPDGSKTDRWLCKDCGARFIRGEQMPGPIVPSDFPSGGASSLGELLDDEEPVDAEDCRLPFDERENDLPVAIAKHRSAAERYKAPGHGDTAARAKWCAYQQQLAAWLQELDDLRLIAGDLHSLAAAAWQHIRATASDDKQRDEANAVCDKLPEGGPLWLCSSTLLAVDSGFCNVATVGIAEANRELSRMRTIIWPLHSLALDLARVLGGQAHFCQTHPDQGPESLASCLEFAQRSEHRLTEGGDLWWLGPGDKEALDWGLVTLGTVRCGACGNEITPPAHLVAVGTGDERLAPMCADCWDTEELRGELAAEQARSPAEDRVLQAALAVAKMAKEQGRPDVGAAAWTWTTEEQELLDAVAELEQGDPNAQPRTDGDAVSQLEANGAPREPGLPTEAAHGPLRWYESAAWLTPPGVPPGPARWYPVAGWLASCLWCNNPTDFNSEDWMALARGAAALTRVMAYAAGCDPVEVPKESFIDAAAELHRVRVQGCEPSFPLPDPPFRAAATATYEECSCCGGSGLDPEVPDDKPHPGWPCLSCWGTGEHRPAEPEVLAIARWLRKTLWPQHEERFQGADHRVAPPGKTLAPVFLAAGAADALELAISRCDSELNSLNDLAARLLEAVLAQHKETDGEPA